MSRNFFRGCAAALVCCVSAAATAGEWANALKPKGQGTVQLSLAKNGATPYVIVIPEKATTQDQKASQDLAQWLHDMTGATFAIVADTATPIATEISIGQTNRLAQAKLSNDNADLGDEGYAIAVDGGRLFLTGGQTRGPINAVYALLEEDLGCRWYAHSESRIPKRPTLEFSPVARRYTPVLRIRDPHYQDAFDPTWSLRNRTNAPFAAVPEEWGGRMDYDGMFVHTYGGLIPADQFKDHPDYFSMIDGNRTPRQLCETNPEVVRLVTEKILQTIEKNPHTEILSISPNDGGGHCDCPTCHKMIEENGSPAATVIDLLNKVGEAIEKDHPGVSLITLAYLDTIDPPKVIRPRKNVAIQLCNDLHSWRYPFTCFATDTQPESKRYRDAITGWAKICNQIYIWDYFVNFSHYLAPMPNMQVLKPSVDFYMANNVKGLMFQGAMQGPGERSLMRSWVMAKLFWDPSLDVDALTQDFVRGYFEESAEPILEYYALLEQARVKHMDILQKPAAGKQKTDVDGACLDVGGIRFSMDSPFFSKELLNQATSLLDKAESQATTDAMRQRVQRERLPITYVKLRQGPDVWGDSYAKLLDEFEAVARREKIPCLREGAADLDQKINAWRASISGEAKKQ